MEQEELPWTGERLVPALTGQIACEHLHRYAIARDAVAGKDVLDIACGEGYGTALLAQRAKSVVGVDVDRTTIEHAARKYPSGNIRFILGECVSIPLPDASVDVVVSFETIEHIQDHETFLSEIRRVLRPGGLVLISTPEKEAYDRIQTSVNPFHVKELSNEAFHSLLGSRFANVAFFSQRYLSGSVILGSGDGSGVPVGNFSGNYSAVDFSQGLGSPVFIIAAASDSSLPLVKTGIFEFAGEAAGDAPPGHSLQVFGDQGGGFSESLSERRAILAGEWQTVSIGDIQLLHRCPERKLRIDPLNTPGVITLSNIRIARASDNATLYLADSESEFAKIECSLGLLAHLNRRELTLFAINADPQIFLPALGDLGSTPCNLEITLKTLPGEEAVCREFNRLLAVQQTLAANEQSLAANEQNQAANEQAIAANERALASQQIQGLNCQLQSLEAAISSAEAWQKCSWFKRAFHRWRSPLNKRAQISAIQGLEPPFRKQCEQLPGEIVPFATRLKSSLLKRFVACREASIRLAVKSRLTNRLRWLDNNARFLRETKLTDEEWYCGQHPEARLQPRDARLHYVRIGAARGWNPSPFFDTAWYLERNPDVPATGQNPAVHYAQNGWREGRNPHPLFNGAWYLENNPDVASAGLEPLAHYARKGWREGRSPSPLFDSKRYLERNPDVASSGVEPLTHYKETGWKEGRFPNPLFDPKWYLKQNPDVASAGVEPLTHYTKTGWKEGRFPNPSFDPKWYLERNPDVAAAGVEPLTHYMKTGWKEGRFPNQSFDPKWYLKDNPDVESAGIEPFTHYLCEGLRQGRKLRPPFLISEQLDAPVPFSKDPEDFPSLPEPDVRLIAFYLPQFHRIPENDAWWGEGFTEWSNVRRAKPQAEGHYQPHVPHRDLGYYDLSDPEVMERQVAMAQKFGIHGFCFYHYWFAGKRLLEMPVQRMLTSGTPNFPFCLCWANENWTRRWDGLDAEILIAQQHSPKHDEDFIRDFIPAMRDPRYIRTGGRPLVLIYRPLLLPDPTSTFRGWREVCREHGIGEIHLAGVLGAGFKDPRPIGLDSAVEFPPNSTGFHSMDTSTVCRGSNPGFRGAFCDYLAVVRTSVTEPVSAFPVFRTVMPSWDNTARRIDCGGIYVNSNPSQYFKWLRFIVDQTRRTKMGDERIAFVNAWNEWAEGCHLEPDAKFGYEWLNATRRALLPPSSRALAPILIIGHDAECAGAQHVLLSLLREWKHTRPFPFCLILNGSGPLRSHFEACCPTLVLSDYPEHGKRRVALDTFLVVQPRLLYSNTVVNGPLLRELHHFGVPVVTHVHELQKSIERWAPGPIFESTLEYSDHFIAVSPPVAGNIKGRHRVPGEAITLIHEFIDTGRPSLEADAAAPIRAELGAAPGDILVFGCGTTDWRKGPDLFVKIAAACRSEPRLRFIWIGGGSAEEQASLNEEIERLSLSGRVRFLGQQSDPRRFFAAGEIFMLSSREDPFPLVALEAADAGLPVMCFAEAGGMPDFVGSDCGFIAPFADTAAAAAAIQRLASDETLRARLGSQAREKVRREHATPAAAARIAELLSKLSRDAASTEFSPNSRPLMSVIVPNYNHAPFLADRLASIVAQGIDDMEIIVLDDASTDESHKILEAFASAHPRTRLVFNEVNSGSTFKQWRKGLAMARGQFVWIAESDDSAEPGLLSALLHKLRRHPDAALAYAQSQMIDNSDRDLGLPLEWTSDLSTTRWLADFVGPGNEEIRTALSIKNSIPNTSAVVFRNFEGIADLVDDSMRLCADWLFWVRLCRRGAVAFDSRALNRWRQRTSNARTRPPGELEWKEGARVVEECAEALGASGREREALLSAFRARCDAWLKTAGVT